VIVGLILLACLGNIDIIMVKHYFSQSLAGYYAAISMIGKVILFATSSLIFVMFPKTSELHSENKETNKMLRSTLFYVVLISTGIVMTYFLAPNLIVSLAFGNEYNIGKYIGWYSIAMALFSINNLFIMYNMAKGKLGFIYGLMVFIIIEVTAIPLFHDTLMSVIAVVAMVMFISLIYLVLYSWKGEFMTMLIQRPEVS